MINNILLISIAQHQITTNIGIDRIAAYLRERNYKVDVIYLDQSTVTSKDLKDISDKYDFYGFSVHSYNYKHCEYVAERLKKSTNPIICYGGVIPSFFYKDIIEKSQNVDYIVLGAGEEPIYDLLKYLAHDNYEAINQMESVVSKNSNNNTKKLHTPKNTYFGEIDDYYERYSSPGQTVYNLITKSNICTHNCSFCLSYKGANFNYLPIETMIENIARRQQKYGINHVFISDDNFLAGHPGDARRRVLEICNEIIRRGLRITLSCNIRADSIHDTIEERKLIQKMSEAGFIYIFVGVESNLEDDLVLYRKKVTKETNQFTINFLKQYNIMPIYGFIVFNPFTNTEKLKINYDFLIKNECVYLNAYARNSLLLEKYTPIYREIKKDNLLVEEPTIENKRAYLIRDPYCRKVENFLYEHFVMDPELGTLDPMQNLLIFFIMRRRHNSQLSKFDMEIDSMKKEFLAVINDYFSKFYVTGDEIGWVNGFNDFKKFLLAFDKRCKIVCEKILKYEFMIQLNDNTK